MSLLSLLKPVPFRQLIHPGDVGSDVLAVKRAWVAMQQQDADKLVLEGVQGETAGPEFVHVLRALRHNWSMPDGKNYDARVHKVTAKHFDAYSLQLYKHAKIRKPIHPGRTGQYRALVDPTLNFAGVDQGIDFTSSGNVYAIADGVVTRCVRSGSGWPGNPGSLLVYHIDGRPWTDEIGNFVYTAEDFDIAGGLGLLGGIFSKLGFGIGGGSRITKGQKIGRANGKWSAPGIECGWADSRGEAIAHAPSSGPTSAGNHFNDHVLALSK